MSRRGRQVVGQLPPYWPLHPFLQFSDNLADRISYVSCMISLLSKKIIVPQAFSWRFADKTWLTARLESFLMRVLRNDSRLELFVYHGWRWVVVVLEEVYKDLYWDLFLTVCFDKVSTRWAHRSNFTFRLGDISRSSNLIEIRRHLGIYTSKETASPNFYSYLDSCITEAP